MPLAAPLGALDELDALDALDALAECALTTDIPA